MSKTQSALPGLLSAARRHLRDARYDEVIAVTRKLIRVAPAEPTAYLYYGEALRKLGHARAALAKYETAIRLGLRTDHVLIAQALALKQLRDLPGAEACLQEALRVNPRSAEARCNLANLAVERGDIAAGIDLYEQARRLAGPAGAIRQNLLTLYVIQERWQAGLDLFESAEMLALEDSSTLRLLAVCCEKLARYADARVLYARTLDRDPTDAVVRRAYANVCIALGDYAAAVEHFARLAADHPGVVAYDFDLGFALRAAGRRTEAVERLQEALALAAAARERGEPGAAATFMRIQCGLGLAQLELGEFRRGWENYEARWHDRADPPDPTLERYLWRGEALAGRRIFVLREQGIGDEIMFASILPEIAAEAAACFIQCGVRIAPAMRRSFPTAAVLPAPEQAGDWRLVIPLLQPGDYCVFCGSLPRFRRPDLQAFGSGGAYLVPDAARVAHWREVLRGLGPGANVGISWRGGTPNSFALQRSLSLAEFLQPVAGCSVNLINLQYFDCTAEIAAARAITGVEVHSFATALGDYDETINLVAALDRVITVQTAIVHVAGALAVPAWVLVPAAPSSWRWLSDDARTPWYANVELFRQDGAGAWAPVLAKLAERARREFAGAA